MKSIRRPLRAILFDFDGVIVESASIKTEAFRELFQNHKGQVEDIVSYHRRHAGISRFKKFDHIYHHILKQPLTREGRRALGRRFYRLVFERVLRCPFVPGAKAFLKGKRPGMMFFVLSGTPQRELRQIVRKRNLRGYFDGVFGSPWTKEEMVGKILARHRLSARDVLFVGDALSDWRAACRYRVPFVSRVPAGERSVFPRSVPCIKDLRALSSVIWHGFKMKRFPN